MIARELIKRISKLEEMALPRNDEMFTTEEHCRSMWRSNPAHCREPAQESGDSIMRSYIPIFEAEDAKRSHEESGPVQRNTAWEEFPADHQNKLSGAA